MLFLTPDNDFAGNEQVFLYAFKHQLPYPINHEHIIPNLLFLSSSEILLS